MYIRPLIHPSHIILSVHLSNYISIYLFVYNTICPLTNPPTHVPLLFEACVVKRKEMVLLVYAQNLMLDNIRELPTLLVEFDTTSNPQEVDVGHYHLSLGEDLLKYINK